MRERTFVRTSEHTTLMPILDEYGNVAGIVCSTTPDERARTEHLEVIATDLRTPLTLVMGPLDELLTSSEDPVTAPRETIEMIQRGAVRVDKLLSALLDFARIDSGRAFATFEPTPLSALTQEIAERFRPLIEGAGLRFTVTCDALDEYVYVDPPLWEEILNDLLENALKFTAEGQIAVALQQRDDRIELTISDTGIGVEDGEIGRLFERGFRGSRSSVRTSDGPGLGLALVRELVELHGGTVTLTSSAQGGAVFVVSLRRGYAHLPVPQVVHEVSRTRAQAVASGDPRPLFWRPQRHFVPPGEASLPRLLLAEDNLEMREYVHGLLSDEWQIEESSDGQDALQKAITNPPDIVVADVCMPELDGLSLVRALRGNPRTSHLPVILLTARTGDAAKAEGLEAGADDYLVKPFTARELRARVRTQLELAQVRRDAMTTANRAKDDFLAMVGHELRNPLATISTMLQALLIRSPSRDVELMERAVRQLTRLVDDLLESSRLSRGRVELQRDVIEIAQVIDRAVELATPALEDKRARVAVSVPRTGCRLNADPERLARAIGNVITNAAQHSNPGSPITVRLDRDGEHARLTIADDGAGIAPERLAGVFQSFQTSERRGGGLGLGLVIARNIVELHGGSITVRSEGIGHGTECTIELTTTTAVAEAVTPSVSTRRKRLLLVEDNNDAAHALKTALEQLGYEVALAHNGPIAINLARSFEPDVALLDLGLPVMDGWELAKRMRVAAHELPIVAVTARDQESDKQRSTELGFADHLVKPIDLAQLARIVEKLPQQNRSGDPARSRS